MANDYERRTTDRARIMQTKYLILLLALTGCYTPKPAMEELPPHVVKVTQLPEFELEIQKLKKDLIVMTNQLWYAQRNANDFERAGAFIMKHILKTNSINLTPRFFSFDETYTADNGRLKLKSGWSKDHTRIETTLLVLEEQP